MQFMNCAPKSRKGQVSQDKVFFFVFLQALNICWTSILSMTAGYLWFYSIILPLQPKVIPNAICGICQKGKEANKKGKPEALIHCSQCDNSGKFTLLILRDCSLFLDFLFWYTSEFSCF